MIRFFVYSFATLMDVILAAVLFVCMVRLADMKASALAVAAIMPVWAVVYMVSSLTAGRLVTPRNAAWILIACCIATVLLAAGFLLLPGVTAMYALMAFQGIATAFFFTPFQVFMKRVDQGRNKGVTHSTGLYTFSWSMGYALGPFIAGYLWQVAGWQACHVFNAIAAAGIAIGVYLLKHHADVAPARPSDRANASSSADASEDYTTMPDWAWMAWTFSGIGCAIASLIRSLFPSCGAEYAISKPDQGTVFFLLSATQAVTGLCLGRGRTWMYRPKPILAFGLLGLIGLGLFAAARTPGQFYAAAVCFGLYSGSFYFYFVFHSLVHPTRTARYISINETVVGLAAILGPFLGGALADRVNLSAPYLAAMAVLAMALPVQAYIHFRHTRRPGIESP
jgi:MFS family permease